MTTGGGAHAACDLRGDMLTLGRAVEESGRRDPAELAALDGEFARLYREMESMPVGGPDPQWLRDVCRTVEGLLRRLGREPGHADGAR